MVDGIGDAFQQETKHRRGRIVRGPLDWANQPGQYKEYPGKPGIELPPPEPRASLPLDQALRLRRSVRDFAPKPLSREHLSYLLWASTGIQRREQGLELRTAPSAGALYPVETYLAVNNAEGVPPGVYHYSVRHHRLEQLHQGDVSQKLTSAAMGQRMCLRCSVVFIWTAIFSRSKWKYGERAYRYVYLDAGHIAQNLALAATSLGLGSCPVGALFDDEVNDIIGVDGVDESTIYMTVVGWPQS